MRPRNPSPTPSGIEQLGAESRHSQSFARPSDGFADLADLADLADITDIDDERLWI